MSLDPALLSILVCPQDHGELEYLQDREVLVNPRLQIAYPVKDGVPVMLPEEAIEWPAGGSTRPAGDASQD